MRRADAVCSKYSSPAGVVLTFHICEYSIEPAVPNRAANLLAKDSLRLALADEPEHFWPEVSFVGGTFLFARCRERLAGARAGPDWGFVCNAGETERERPAADAGEEMDLGIAFDFIGLYIRDRAGVHNAGGNLAGGD